MLKFEKTGSLLNAWVTTYEAFTSAPQISYNISSDTKIIYSGKAALLVRTTMPGSTYQTFVDAVKVKAVIDFSNNVEFINGVYSAYCPSEMLYYDLRTDTGMNNLYYDMQYWLNQGSWKLIEMTSVNQNYRQIDDYTYEITIDKIEYDMWSSREISGSSGEIEDFINTDNIYVNGEESEEDGFAIEYYKFFETLGNNGNNSFWVSDYALIGYVTMLIRGLCSLGIYILEKMAIETLTIPFLTFGYGSMVTTITIEVSALISLLNLVSIALVIIVALLGILVWVINSN